MNNSLNHVLVENLNCFTLNKFGFVNWAKIISTIHVSKFHMAKITFFDDSVILSDEFQTESRKSKVISIIPKRP